MLARIVRWYENRERTLKKALLYYILGTGVLANLGPVLLFRLGVVTRESVHTIFVYEGTAMIAQGVVFALICVFISISRFFYRSSTG